MGVEGVGDDIDGFIEGVHLIAKPTNDVVDDLLTRCAASFGPGFLGGSVIGIPCGLLPVPCAQRRSGDSSRRAVPRWQSGSKHERRCPL